MQGLRSFQKPLLMTMAILFAAGAILYSALWTLYGDQPAPVELGFESQYIPAEHSELVQSVVPGSPAERAGMKPGDRIIKINGARVEEDSMIRVWLQYKPGDSVELDIQRQGISDPIVLHATFRPSGSTSGGGRGSTARGTRHPSPVSLCFSHGGLGGFVTSPGGSKRLAPSFDVWWLHRHTGVCQLVLGCAPVLATIGDSVVPRQNLLRLELVSNQHHSRTGVGPSWTGRSNVTCVTESLGSRVCGAQWFLFST